MTQPYFKLLMTTDLGGEALAVRVLVQAVQHGQAGGGGGDPAQQRRPARQPRPALGLGGVCVYI